MLSYPKREDDGSFIAISLFSYTYEYKYKSPKWPKTLSAVIFSLRHTNWNIHQFFFLRPWCYLSCKTIVWHSMAAIISCHYCSSLPSSKLFTPKIPTNHFRFPFSQNNLLSRRFGPRCSPQNPHQKVWILDLMPFIRIVEYFVLLHYIWIFNQILSLENRLRMYEMLFCCFLIAVMCNWNSLSRSNCKAYGMHSFLLINQRSKLCW